MAYVFALLNGSEPLVGNTGVSKMLKNMKFRPQLWLSHGTLLVLMIIIAGVVYQSVNSILLNSQLVTHTYKVIEQSELLQKVLLDMETGVRGFIITGQENFLEPHHEGEKLFKQMITKLQKQVSDNPSQLELLKKVHLIADKWNYDVLDVAVAKRNKVVDGGDADSFKEVVAFVASGQGKNLMDEMRELIGKFINNEKALLQNREKEAANTANLVIKITLFGTGVAFLFGIILIIFITSNIMRIVAKVIEASIEMNVATNEIAKGNINLSQRTEEQAASLEETSSSMEEMTSTIQQNANNAKQARQLAKEAQDQAQQGGDIVGQAVTAMNEINTSSKQVADIISVIDEIAFQTNLLALNAAVEAARAGEQGRGFAVVATEVRTLAQRSAAAAKDIKDLIQDSVKKTEEGTNLVNHSGNTLEAIIKAVKKVNDMITEITAASVEQSSGIQQINKAVMQLDEITQQNAELVEEAASVSESVKKQAQNLREQVAFFGTDENNLVTDAHDAHDAHYHTTPLAEKRAIKHGVERNPNLQLPSKERHKISKGTFHHSDQEWQDF